MKVTESKGSGMGKRLSLKTRLHKRARSFSSRLHRWRPSLKNTFGHLMDIAARGGSDHVRFLPFSPAVFRHRAFGSIRNAWRLEHFNIRVSRILTRTRNVYSPGNVRPYESIARMDHSWTIIRYSMKWRDLYTGLRGFGLFDIWNTRSSRQNSPGFGQSSPAAAVSQSAWQLLSAASRYVSPRSRFDGPDHAESGVSALSAANRGFASPKFVYKFISGPLLAPRGIVRPTLPSRMHGGTLRNNGCIALPTSDLRFSSAVL